MKEACGIGVVYVTTAVELDEGQKKAVEDKLLKTSGYKIGRASCRERV